MAPVRVATTKVRTSAIVPAQEPEWTLTTPGVATEVRPVVASMAIDSKIVFSTKVWNLGSIFLFVFPLPLSDGLMALCDVTGFTMFYGGLCLECCVLFAVFYVVVDGWLIAVRLLYWRDSLVPCG